MAAPTYTVQQGDSMWKIANDHGISLDALIAANPQVADPGVIEVLQVLNLPQPAGGPPAPPPAVPAAPESAPPAAEGDRGVAISSVAAAFTGGRPGYKTVGYFTNWVSCSPYYSSWYACLEQCSDVI